METSRDEKLKDWTAQTLKAAVHELLERGITDTPLVEAKRNELLVVRQR
jgi:hypothetical protein